VAIVVLFKFAERSCLVSAVNITSRSHHCAAVATTWLQRRSTSLFACAFESHSLTTFALPNKMSESHGRAKHTLPVKQGDDEATEEDTSLTFSVDWLINDNAEPPKLCKTCTSMFDTGKCTIRLQPASRLRQVSLTLDATQ